MKQQRKWLWNIWILILVGSFTIGHVQARQTLEAAQSKQDISVIVRVIDDLDSERYSTTQAYVDSQGRTHICYQGANEDLLYGLFDGAAWTTEIVDDNGWVAQDCDIVIDSNDRPHISYRAHRGNEDLRYAHQQANGTWTTTIVASQGSIGMQSSIALAQDDEPHIIHHLWSGGHLMYSYLENGSWQTETVATDSPASDTTALVIDQLGNLHAIYSNIDHILYAVRRNGVWEEPAVVAACGWNDCGMALAIDGLGRLHLTYSTDDTLWYATRDLGAWEKTAVVENIKTYGHQDITIDEQHSVSISYRDGERHSLRLASNKDGTWETHVVDSSGDVGRANTIVIPNNDEAQIIYRDDGILTTLTGVWGCSANNIFTVDNIGRIFHFDGATWQLAHKIDTPLRDIWGSSCSNVYTVGDAGNIWHYNGSVWQAMSTPTLESLHGIWGFTAEHIMVVGNRGTILQFDGIEWSEIDSGITTHLYAVWGTTTDHVYVVGHHGHISHYNGQLWQTVDSPAQLTLHAIWGRSTTEVYAVGLSGTMIQYDGEAWQFIDPGTTLTLYDVWGTSDEIYVAANIGNLLRHDGTSWQSVPIDMERKLIAMHGLPDGHMVVVGERGALLHSADGIAWQKMLTPKLKSAHTFCKHCHLYLPFIGKATQ